jgi:hypothetical protein
MKEKIKQLAEQAGIQDNPDQEGLDLFAELIILECADIAGDDWDTAGTAILKHFGVKR